MSGIGKFVFGSGVVLTSLTLGFVGGVLLTEKVYVESGYPEVGEFPKRHIHIHATGKQMEKIETIISQIEDHEHHTNL